MGCAFALRHAGALALSVCLCCLACSVVVLLLSGQYAFVTGHSAGQNCMGLSARVAAGRMTGTAAALHRVMYCLAKDFSILRC